MPLYDILKKFQKGHSHIAVVYKDLNEKKEGEQFKDRFKKSRGQPEKSMKKGECVWVACIHCTFIVPVRKASVNFNVLTSDIVAFIMSFH